MNSKTLRAKYLKFAILIISVCFILGAISACLPFNISIPTLGNDTIDNTAMTIMQNSTDGLGEFNNGYSYVYTNKDLIDDYRTGDPNTPYDISVVKVDTSKGRGTKENPFVIASVDDWTRFAKNLDDGSIASYGSGKYFVLANDIDFDSKTFYPVRFFNGTFYGMGHSLKNITVTRNGWIYWNGTTYATIPTTGTGAPLGYGLFGRTTGAMITDLILEDFSYQDMPNYSSGSSMGMTTASIIGLTSGNDCILNCHVSGEIKSPNIAYSGNYISASGIVGLKINNATTLFIYRCSAELVTEINFANTSYCQFSGGILGGTSSATGNIDIYDCVANLRATVMTARHQHIGGLVGLVWNGSSTLNVENAHTSIDINSTVLSSSGMLGCIWGGPKASMANCYASGETGAVGAKTSMYPFVRNQYSSMTSIKNVNTIKTTTNYAPNGNANAGFVNAFAGSSEWKEYTTTNYTDPNASMLSDAKTFFGANYPQIWDVDKIGGSYDPDNSPVRNYLMAFINFRNLNNGGNSEEKVGLEDGEPYVVGDKLPDDTSTVSTFITYLNNKKNANHVFKGWTDDPTGASEPFTELPSGLFGDVTLYAVWGLPDSYVNSNIKTSLSVDKNLIEYDSVASITLTAKVEHTAPSSGAMTNPKPTYYFVQDGEEKTTTADVKSSGVLSVKTVKDSGKYTFKYRLTDGLEPLWFYDGNSASSEEKTITIEKGKLEHMTLKDFKISASTVPYFGKKLEDITFTVSMFNNASKEVELAEVKWQSTIGKVDTKGTNTKKIVLCPVDTDNYEEQYVFDATFESQSLVIVFNMAQISQKIEVEVEYGQNYGANEIIYLFEQAYLKALSTWDAEIVGDVSSMAPYLDGKALADGDANADKFDTAYNGINEIHTIEVTFKDASYEVVFNPNNGGASQPTQETYGYGQFLKKPNDPVNGDLLFVGWYFDDVTVDENGNSVTTNRAWRFNSVGDTPQDRVTKAVTLIAKWLKADTLDSIKVEVDPSKKYMAQTSLQEGDLIVTA
ncbi:MAG: InlB B-repeat-containing protein, partial [Clostridia bacterium]|nr:InlB B-repeat-containing protein [Clostridia bacterium]